MQHLRQSTIQRTSVGHKASTVSSIYQFIKFSIENEKVDEIITFAPCWAKNLSNEYFWISQHFMDGAHFSGEDK